MKKIITMITALTLFGCSGAYADEICESHRGLASSVMKGRQDGIPFNRHFGIAVKVDSENGTNGVQRLVVRAHSYPMILNEDHKQAMIDQFANDIYMECAAYRKSKGLM